MVKYMSYSSIKLYLKDQEEYYSKYLTKDRPPRMPQTQPMSIGSAFDARIKSHLHERLFGRIDPKYTFEALFEEQVQEHNRDWALEHSAYVFNAYKQSGAVVDLMLELEQAIDDPRFEFKVEGNVIHESEIEGVPLLGYPDIYFITKEGYHVVYDWKVNGYCSNSATSPKKGFLKITDGWSSDLIKHSRSHDSSHKDAMALVVSGILLNIAVPFEDCFQDWAEQLSIYGWLEGMAVGGKIIGGIDQLICDPTKGTSRPLIRVARFRGKISPEFQKAWFTTIYEVWKAVNRNDFLDPNQKELLDTVHRAFLDDNPKEKLFTNWMRKHRNF